MDTIEWGDEIAVDGKRPEWLRDDDVAMYKQSDYWLPNATEDQDYEWSVFTAIRLPKSHRAYLAISRGFTPWGGGDEAPGDWVGYGEGIWPRQTEENSVLYRNGTTGSPSPTTLGRWRHGAGTVLTPYEIIGYRSRSTPEYGKIHTDGSRSGSQPPTFRQGDYVVYTKPYSDYVVGKVYEIRNGEIIGELGDPRTWFKEETRPATPAEIEQYEAERGLVERYEGEPVKVYDPAPLKLVSLLTRDEVLARADEKEWASPNTSRMAYLNAYEDLGLIRAPEVVSDLDRFEDLHGGLDNNQRDIAELAIKWARENG